jgi:cyclophilin family peptidyl-prolyl cis-trans isomerase
MMTFSRRLFSGIAVAALALAAVPAMAQGGKPHLILTLEGGTVDIELLPEIAPKHVERVIALTEAGDYDGVVFHRVIDGFMAQTGDVKFGKTGAQGFDLSRAGMGGSDQPDVQAEFNSESFQRGVVGAARAQDPNSFNSQFFICFEDASFLNRQYTVWGQVIEGMENVDKIKRGEPVQNPDKIVSLKVAADVAA